VLLADWKVKNDAPTAQLSIPNCSTAERSLASASGDHLYRIGRRECRRQSIGVLPVYIFGQFDFQCGCRYPTHPKFLSNVDPIDPSSCCSLTYKQCKLVKLWFLPVVFGVRLSFGLDEFWVVSA